MKNKDARPSGPLPLARAEGQNLSAKVSVNDLADVLRDLSVALGNASAGNPLLGRALSTLSKVLRRHADWDLEQLLNGLAVTPRRRSIKRARGTSLLQGVDVACLDLREVREVLRSDKITKGDLIELGSKRFGISQSRLIRQNREALAESIEAALRNSEALDIISEQASLEGSQRSR